MKRPTVSRLLAGFSLVLCAACPSLALADDGGRIESPYFGIGANYIFSDERARPVFTDDGQGLQLFFGWPSSRRWAFEVHLTHDEFDTPVANTNADRTALGLDGVFYVNPASFTPYFLAGIGAAHNNPGPGDDKTDVFGNVGVGLMTARLNSYGWRLRGDVRYVVDNYHRDPEDVHLNLALVVPTRRPQTVVRTEVREVIREVPRPAPVVAADSDRDGVVDGVDRCPNTMRGAEVDRYGCAKQRAVVTLRDVNFEFNSAGLTPASRSLLQSAVDAMNGQPNMGVEIAGHTDHIGSHAYNQRLSEQRAMSVVDFLAKAGIARSRLKAVGYGETRPAAPNTRPDGSDNPEGRAQNRRVEFKILYQ